MKRRFRRGRRRQVMFSNSSRDTGLWPVPSASRTGQRPVSRLALLGIGLILQGCASYATPGGGANMKALGVTEDMREANTDGLIRQALDRKPLATFPTAIAVARVQAAGYCSPTARGWGHGNYSVLTTRDIEKPQQIARLCKLPMISGIAPM